MLAIARLLELPRVSYTFGTNEHGEFSAWIEGLSHLYDSAPASGPIFLINDTYIERCQHYSARFHFFLDRSDKLACATKPVIVGDVITPPRPFRVLGGECAQFVRTAFFFLNAPAVVVLKETYTRVHDLSQLDVGEEKTQADFVGRYYDNSDSVDRIANWLFVRGWKDAKPFQEFDEARLRHKLFAIAMEHTLSFNIRCLDGEIADTGVRENMRFWWQLKMYLSSGLSLQAHSLRIFCRRVYKKIVLS
jgi:hypothetical protein